MLVSDQSPRKITRGPALRRAILGTALGLLAEGGLDGFSVAEVARRVGVHQTSIYRKWHTREELALETVLIHSGANVLVPDTGTLRSDLVGFVSGIVALLSNNLARTLLTTLAVLPPQSEDMVRARENFWKARSDDAIVMLERAKMREEIPSSVNSELAMEIIMAPVHDRVLLTGRPLNSEFISDLVDMVVDGIRWG